MPISLNRPPPPPEPQPQQTPPPPPQSSFTFCPPQRRIVSPQDLKLFQSSSTHDLLLGFITDLNTSVLNLKTSTPIPTPEIIPRLLSLLTQTRGLLSQHPPDQTASRFGNPTFRKWYDAVQHLSAEWHKEWLGDAAAQEPSRYFAESFGNRERIDYGSGHELNFVAWLLCLQRLGHVPTDAHAALVLRVFVEYLETMREVQTTYFLEPAGSHGVWGLDDYQFLPFLWGSAQLYSHPHIRPKAIHNPDVLEEFAGEYMYLGCIAFINSVKTTAGLRWHSPMLDDISAARNWGKINDGMRKMYETEVLGKLPVMQHFMFGGILKAEEGMEEGSGDKDDTGHHGHKHEGWGDCCGIKVPASVAARRAEEGKGLRRLPFD